MLESLPLDILLYIIDDCSLVTIPKVELVCKSWRRVIKKNEKAIWTFMCLKHSPSANNILMLDQFSRNTCKQYALWLGGYKKYITEKNDAFVEDLWSSTYNFFIISLLIIPLLCQIVFHHILRYDLNNADRLAFECGTMIAFLLNLRFVHLSATWLTLQIDFHTKQNLSSNLAYEMGTILIAHFNSKYRKGLTFPSSLTIATQRSFLMRFLPPLFSFVHHLISLQFLLLSLKFQGLLSRQHFIKIKDFFTSWLQLSL
jgi:hypothetical protein